jgi:hypothetical protein
MQKWGHASRLAVPAQRRWPLGLLQVHRRHVLQPGLVQALQAIASMQEGVDVSIGRAAARRSRDVQQFAFRCGPGERRHRWRMRGIVDRWPCSERPRSWELWRKTVITTFGS